MPPPNLLNDTRSRIAAQRGARRIVRDVVVGALEGVHGVGLQRGDRLRGAAHVAGRDEAAQLVVVADEAAAEVEPSRVRAAGEERRRAGIERAVDAGEHQADVAAAVGVIALQAEDAVVRPRLDRRVPAIDDLHALDALGHRVEQADGEAIGEAARELGRGGDRRRGGAGGVAVLAGELRAPADAARVEQAGAAAVDVAAVGVEA